jgi:hypothetical protein
VIPLALKSGSIGIGIFSEAVLLTELELSFVKVSRSILYTTLSINHTFLNFANKRKGLRNNLSLSVKSTLHEFSSIDISIFEDKFSLTLHLIINKPSFVHPFRKITSKSQNTLSISGSIFHLSLITTSITVLDFASSIGTSFTELAYNSEFAKCIH